ncbi:MAG: hypothetical protein AAFP02_01615 [Bacteroidota bacterium]
MKRLYHLVCVLLIMLCWIGCEEPSDFLQGNTWILYKHIYINTIEQEEVKDSFTLSERKLVLSFGESTVNWIENERPMLGEYHMLDTGYLHMMGHDFRINRLGELIMVLEKEDDESLTQYYFLPEDCACWDES